MDLAVLPQEAQNGPLNVVYPNSCDKCPLRRKNSVLGHPVMSGDGSSTPEVIFIGEAPGGEEDKEGVPFVGPAGRLLRSALSKVNYSYFFTNAIRCRPWTLSDNGNVVNRTPIPQEVSSCHILLVDELSRFSPKLYVLLGRTAVKAILGQDLAIKTTRGSILRQEGQIPCLVTYHPSALLRNQDDKVLLSAFAYDLDLIPKFLANQDRQPIFHFIHTQEDMVTQHFDAYVFDHRKLPCAIDFETENLAIHTTKVLCVSFCWDELETWIVDLNNYELWEDTKDILNWIYPIIHNAAFDSQVNNKFSGEFFNHFDDTMILHAIQYPEASHKLEDIARTYCPEFGNYKFSTKGTMEKYDIKDVMKRCGYDTLATYRIFNKLMAQITPLQKHLYNRMKLASKTLTKIMWNGVKINPDKLSFIIKEYENQSKELLGNLRLYGDTDFDSPKQVAQLFYRELKFPTLKEGKSGIGSVDADTLKELAHQIDHPILATYTEYSSIKTLLRNTLKNLEASIQADRVYTSYNITGARTARLSSSSPNLQNIMGPIREAFIPNSESHIFIKCDCNQMELRWAGILSQDPKFIEIYNTPGMDLHQQTLLKIQQRIPTATRLDAKTVNFGMIFLQSVASIARELHCLEPEARDFTQANRVLFHGYWDWVDRVKRRVIQGKPVFTWWGRERYFPEDQIPAAVNFPIQSSASDFVVLYLLPELKRYDWVDNISLTTHDDIIFSIPNTFGTVQALISRLENLTQEFNKLVPIPMKLDYFYGKNWKEVYEIKLEFLQLY